MKSFQSFRLDTANQCLWRGRERVPIPPKAYDVLRYLVENPGRLVTQDELLEAVWPETYVNPEILRKYILDIRKTLGDRPDKPVFIETVTKRGYRFIAPVIEESAVEEPKLARSGEGEDGHKGSVATSEQQEPSVRNYFRKLAIITVLAAVAAGVTAGRFWFAHNKASHRSSNATSVAVLPFANLSAGKDQEYFSDGLAEELITDLTQIPGLKVVARSSAFQFKGKNEDLRSVGQKLGVANVLEGSVRKEGDRVRITAALTKVDDGFQLWSETYDRDVTHIFAAQDEIARAVTDALQVKLLSAGGGKVSASTRSTNPKAYQAYLQGEYFAARGQDREDLNKALNYAEQAIKLDAQYAPAWAQRAQVLVAMARVAVIKSTDGFRRARESAEKAIALDPNLAAGYMGLSMVQINSDWDWEGAHTSLKKAGLLAPGNATVLGDQAYLARTLGKMEEAIALYKQAIALDPLRANFHLALGYELYSLGRYQEAEAALQRAEELNPQLSSLHLTRSKILFSEDREQEALTEIAKETGDWEKLSGEALAYYAAGRLEESDKALKKLITHHQDDGAFQIAEAYAYRGDIENAFRWMERAFRQRDPGSPEMKSNPLMKSLRQDPRFAEFLKKMRLPTQGIQ